MSIEEIPAEVVAAAAAELETQAPAPVELSGDDRYADIMARLESDPASLTDEELDFAEGHKPGAAPAPEAPAPAPAPTEDPLAEAMKLVGAKDVSELGAKVRELRGKVGEIGDKSNRELQEVRALAEQRAQHERFVSALAAGDANAWAALEKIRPGSIAAAKAQPQDDGPPDDVLDPKAWAVATAAEKRAMQLEAEMKELREWRQAQTQQQSQLVEHERAVNMTLATVSAVAASRPELADPALLRDVEAYMWSQPGNEPSIGDSARTIIGAMELGSKLGIASLAEAVDAYARLYPDKVKAPPAQAAQAPTTPAPKQALPGMVAAKAMGSGSGLDAYTEAQILSGDFPDHWIEPNGKPNWAAIPQQYHGMF